MSNATVAELITVSITGEPVRGEVIDVVDIAADRSGELFLDVVLRGGRVVEGASALDIFPITASALDAATAY